MSAPGFTRVTPGTGSIGPVAVPAPARVRGRRRWRRPPAFVLVCAAILTVMALSGILADVVAPRDPAEQHLDARLKPPFWLPGTNPAYVLGTDQLGRDVLSRILYGARISLSIGLLAAAIGAIVGTLVGSIAGYVGGFMDDAIMMLADIQLAFPFVLLAIAIIAVLGPDRTAIPIKLIILVGLSSWMMYARVSRGLVLALKRREFIEAVRALGGSHPRILFRHLLPNLLSSVIVLATIELARVIILESTLSFLGMGIQPPTPSWGGMLGEGRQYLATAWWIATFPGLAILLTVMTISRAGDWLGDVLDPTRGDWS